MRKKLSQLSIRIQLLFLIVVVLLPVCSILIMTASVTVKNTEQHLFDSYQNELNNFAEDIENTVFMIQEENDNLFLEYVSFFTRTTVPDRMSRIEVMQDLSKIWKRIEFCGATALHMPDSDEVYVSHDVNWISFEEYENLQKMIKEMQPQKPGMIHVMSSEAGKYYYMVSYPYQKSHILYILPCEMMISLLKERNVDGSVEVSLYAQDDRIASSVKNENDRENGRKFMHGEAHVLEINLPYTNHRIEMVLDKTSITGTMPVSILMIRSLCIGAVLMLPLLWFFIKRLVLKPIGKMNDAMEQVEKENLDYRLDWEKAESRETIYMEKSFNSMVEQIQNLRIEKYETELKKRDIEVMNLKLQINPHLLLNSMNMVHSLAQMGDCDTIRKFSMNLSNYFRYTLRNTESMVRLEEEINFVKSYLEIQKIRYPKMFVHVYYIEDGLEKVRIPSLLIENFVENSIKYGLSPEKEMELLIIARKEEENIVISVVDNGNGMSAEKLKKLQSGEIIEDRVGSHIGIWNIRRRLEMIYGSRAELSISSELQEGTQVWMKIPVGIE